MEGKMVGYSTILMLAYTAHDTGHSVFDQRLKA